MVQEAFHMTAWASAIASGTSTSLQSISFLGDECFQYICQQSLYSNWAPIVCFTYETTSKSCRPGPSWTISIDSNKNVLNTTLSYLLGRVLEVDGGQFDTSIDTDTFALELSTDYWHIIGQYFQHYAEMMNTHRRQIHHVTINNSRPLRKRNGLL